MTSRAAVVGTGAIADAHAAALREAAVPAELVTAADVRQEALDGWADRWEVESRYTSLEDLLAAERPDVVHLCTPPGLHLEQALACLRAGAHVVCEKPPVLSLAQHDEVAAAERSTGRHFVPVFQQRTASSAAHVRRLLEAGELGRPLVALCHTLWFREESYYEAAAWRSGWDAGGGPTGAMAVHQIDLLLHLLGDWTRVEAVAARIGRAIDTEDVSMAHVTFASGAVASVVSSVLSPREVSSLRIDCEEATVELDHLYGYTGADWRLTPRRGLEAPPTWSLPSPDVPSGHVAFLTEVYGELAAGLRPAAAGDAGRRALEVVTAVYASALAGGPVTRTDLVPGHPGYDGLPGERSDGQVPPWALARSAAEVAR